MPECPKSPSKKYPSALTARVPEPLKCPSSALRLPKCPLSVQVPDCHPRELRVLKEALLSPFLVFFQAFTRRTLEGNSKGTRGTLWHSGTQGTWTLRHLGTRGTRATLFSRLHLYRLSIGNKIRFPCRWCYMQVASQVFLNQFQSSVAAIWKPNH